MFKTFYIHYNVGTGKLPNQKPRGFTMEVMAHKNPRLVEVRGAFCSPKDQFCKKTGRSYAAAAQSQLIHKRRLPNILVAMQTVVMGGGHVDDWYYVLKYVV